MTIRKNIPKFNPWQNLQRWLYDLDAKAKRMLDHFIEKFSNLAETNYQLALKMIEQGRINDAAVRLRFALWFDPKHYHAWYNFGCCYLSKGRPDGAAVAFRKALALKPDYEEARFMLGSVSKDFKERSTVMPRSLSLNYFEILAPHYTLSQLEQFNYKGHVHLAQLVSALWDKNRIDHVVLDIGCGTGFVGQILRPQSTTVVGVDMTRGMLDIAAQLKDTNGAKIYDELIHQDIRDYLPLHHEPKYDIVTAAWVFNFIGDIGAIIDGVAKLMKPGALFVFSTDKFDGPGFQLLPGITRFGHSRAYIEGLAACAGLTLERAEEVKIYPNTTGLQVALRK